MTKFVAYLLTLSSSMLAESIHSVADSGNQMLLLVGGRRAQRSADARAPVRLRPAALRLRVHRLDRAVLASAASSPSTRRTTNGRHPEPIEGRWWWVPLACSSSRSCWSRYSLRTAIASRNHSRGERSWVEFVRTAKAPELPVVLLEDAAALLGLVFALFGVGLTLVTGDGRWDAVGTALIGAAARRRRRRPRPSR